MYNASMELLEKPFFKCELEEFLVALAKVLAMFNDERFSKVSRREEILSVQQLMKCPKNFQHENGEIFFVMEAKWEYYLLALGWENMCDVECAYRGQETDKCEIAFSVEQIQELKEHLILYLEAFNEDRIEYLPENQSPCAAEHEKILLQYMLFNANKNTVQRFSVGLKDLKEFSNYPFLRVVEIILLFKQKGLIELVELGIGGDRDEIYFALKLLDDFKNYCEAIFTKKEKAGFSKIQTSMFLPSAVDEFIPSKNSGDDVLWRGVFLRKNAQILGFSDHTTIKDLRPQEIEFLTYFKGREDKPVSKEDLSHIVNSKKRASIERSIKRVHRELKKRFEELGKNFPIVSDYMDPVNPKIQHYCLKTELI